MIPGRDVRILFTLCCTAEIFLAVNLFFSEVTYRQVRDQPENIPPPFQEKKITESVPAVDGKDSVKKGETKIKPTGSRYTSSSHTSTLLDLLKLNVSAGIIVPQAKPPSVLSELQLQQALMKSFGNCSSRHDDEQSRDHVELCIRTDHNSEDKYNDMFSISPANSSVKCYRRGTVGFSVEGGCECLPDWSGQWCSVPPAVTLSDYPQQYGLSLRSAPRRIIYMIPFLQEFDFLEDRVRQYGDAVEAYVIVESNFSARGTPKPRYLREMLKNDVKYLEEYRSKLVIADLNFFPVAAYTNGWIAEELHRTYGIIGGVTHLRGLVHDDILISTDADEIPSREVLEFLRIHDGYPEPMGFLLRHHVFSMKWFGPKLVSQVFGTCSFGMLHHLFQANPYNLRGFSNFMKLNKISVNIFQQNFPDRLRVWNFGITKVRRKSRNVLPQQKSLKVYAKNHHTLRKPSDFSNSANVAQKLEIGVFNSNLTTLNTSDTSNKSNSTSQYDDDGLAGEHCSWCYDAQGILYKIHTAQVSDGPRWDKRIRHDDVKLIVWHVEKGLWFDNVTKLIPANT